MGLIDQLNRLDERVLGDNALGRTQLRRDWVGQRPQTANMIAAIGLILPVAGVLSYAVLTGNWADAVIVSGPLVALVLVGAGLPLTRRQGR